MLLRHLLLPPPHAACTPPQAACALPHAACTLPHAAHTPLHAACTPHQAACTPPHAAPPLHAAALRPLPQCCSAMYYPSLLLLRHVLLSSLMLLWHVLPPLPTIYLPYAASPHAALSHVSPPPAAPVMLLRSCKEPHQFSEAEAV
jgi:hypothetical protein